ncbi:hypothetical protein D3C85_1027430 [compost metagenome]
MFSRTTRNAVSHAHISDRSSLIERLIDSVGTCFHPLLDEGSNSRLSKYFCEELTARAEPEQFPRSQDSLIDPASCIGPDADKRPITIPPPNVRNGSRVTEKFISAT